MLDHTTWLPPTLPPLRDTPSPLLPIPMLSILVPALVLGSVSPGSRRVVSRPLLSITAESTRLVGTKLEGSHIYLHIYTHIYIYINIYIYTYIHTVIHSGGSLFERLISVPHWRWNEIWYQLEVSSLSWCVRSPNAPRASMLPGFPKSQLFLHKRD